MISFCMKPFSMAFTAPPKLSICSMYFVVFSSISSVKYSMKYDPASGSTVSTTPLSWAIICCVLSATVTACSLGNA